MSTGPDAANVLDAMGAIAREHVGSITYLPGTVILREGERGGSAYLIESGDVRVSKRIGAREQDIAVLSRGQLIGEMAPIDDRARSATVTALTQVELVPITRAHLESVMEHADPLLNVMLRTMFGRVREMQRRLLGPQDGLHADPTGLEPRVDEQYRQALSSASEQLKMEKALAEALRRREFVLHYQPIVSLVDRSVAGFEALIRWIRPDVGMVPPLEFVGAAERTGLIVPIGLWILDQTGYILQRLRGAVRAATGEDRPLFLTVNVSARQLRSLDEVQAMCSAIHASGVDPESLKLEITENVLVDQGDVALEALRRLRNMGVAIAIDDFGTGYSSLSYLHRYPVDTLKIDRSFTSSMGDSRQSLQLTRSIVRLAQGMELDVVAEGIEKEHELRTLADMQCRYGQGYLFSRPVSLEDAERLLAG